MYSEGMRARVFLVLVLSTLWGCPRDRPAPEPENAEPCDTLADCNCGLLCGALRACVGGSCELEPNRSVVRPCEPDTPDAGVCEPGGDPQEPVVDAG